MPTQAEHTVVRISLRSMFAITFALSVLLAISAPYLRHLGRQSQLSLLFTLAWLSAGAAIQVIVFIVQRNRLRDRAGRLLLSLPLLDVRGKRIRRWVWLLLGFPFALIFFWTLIDKKWDQGLLRHLPSLLFYSWYGYGLSKGALMVCLEGYADSADLYEEGFLFADKYYEWDSSALRDVYWNTKGDALLVNIDRSLSSIHVPPHLREAVDAVIEHYYKPARRATDQT